MKTIYLNGVVGYDITGESIRKEVDFSSTDPLRVVVNSPGGYVSDAFEIYNLFSTYKGTIEGVILGYAMSAMSYIIMSFDKISAFKNSIFMAHRVQSIALGNSDEILREAEISKSMDNIIAESYMKRMNKDKDEIKNLMTNELWLVGWEQLVEFGIIDNVIDKEDEIEIPEFEEKTDQYDFLFSNEFNKQDAIAKSKMNLISVQKRMRNDEERLRTNSERAAALIDISSKVDLDINNNKTEVTMDLKEFLKSNPEAHNAYEISLQNARVEGREEAEKEIVNSDRERIAEILKIANVSLSSEAISALEKGIDSGTFAKQEIERQNQKRTDNADVKSIFSDLAIKQTPKEQDPNNKEDIDSFEEKARAKAKALIGGK